MPTTATTPSMSCRPKSVAVCEGPGWGWLNGAEARGGDGDGPRTAARPMDLPCPVGGGETTHGPTMSIGKRKDALWTLRVHWEEEKCPTDPPCPLGRGEMPHGPSVSSGRRSDAPWTPHVHWDPLCPWRRRRDAPWTPPPMSSGRRRDCDARVAPSAASCPHACTVTVGLQRKV